MHAARVQPSADAFEIAAAYDKELIAGTFDKDDDSDEDEDEDEDEDAMNHPTNNLTNTLTDNSMDNKYYCLLPRLSALFANLCPGLSMAK